MSVVEGRGKRGKGIRRKSGKRGEKSGKTILEYGKEVMKVKKKQECHTRDSKEEKRKET